MTDLTADRIVADPNKTSVVHCWAEGMAEDGCPVTCMLLDGHAGEHEWTRDEHIIISFVPALLKTDDPASELPSNENVAEQPT